MIEWKDIPGYEGEYQASKCGRIRSIDRLVIKSNGRIARYKSKERKPQINGGGYNCVNLRQSDQHLWHRLVAITWVTKLEGKDFVNHKDGDKTNNRADNLEWTTRLENEHHAYSTGLKNSTGSNNTMAKLNEEKVREIRELVAGGRDKTSVANQFGVHKGTIDRVVSKRIWAHV